MNKWLWNHQLNEHLLGWSVKPHNFNVGNTPIWLVLLSIISNTANKFHNYCNNTSALDIMSQQQEINSFITDTLSYFSNFKYTGKQNDVGSK